MPPWSGALDDSGLIWGMSPASFAKIFHFAAHPNHFHIRRRPPLRGVSGSSRTRGWMRWTQAARLTSAQPCGRRSRVVLTPRRWRQIGGSNSTNDGDNKARSPRRARRKPLKPLRREGRSRSGEPVVTNLRVFYSCTQGCGRIGRPVFPAPSSPGGTRSIHRLGVSRRGIECVCLSGRLKCEL